MRYPFANWQCPADLSNIWMEAIASERVPGAIGSIAVGKDIWFMIFSPATSVLLPTFLGFRIWLNMDLAPMQWMLCPAPKVYVPTRSPGESVTERTPEEKVEAIKKILKGEM